MRDELFLNRAESVLFGMFTKLLRASAAQIEILSHAHENVIKYQSRINLPKFLFPEGL